MMLDGDDSTAFTLFANLLCAGEAKAAQEECTSFLVEHRMFHANSDCSAVSIPNVMQYLLPVARPILRYECGIPGSVIIQ